MLEIEELARLWSAAAHEPHYVSMFLLLALGTGARPGTILDLTREQVNVERGYIDLNPPGRARTAKGRPVVPLAPVLRPWIATVTAGHLVQLDGRPLGSIKSAFRRLRAKAGLGPEVVPHVLRHTVATHLHRAGVPVDQIAAFLGHSTGRRTTERYLHHRPEHLAAARDAVQELISETARVTAEPSLCHSLAEIGVRVPHVCRSSLRGPGQLLEFPGAGEGIRTLDPNLGKVVLSVFRSFPDPNPAWKASENQLSSRCPAFPGLDGDYRFRLRIAYVRPTGG